MTAGHAWLLRHTASCLFDVLASCGVLPAASSRPSLDLFPGGSGPPATQARVAALVLHYLRTTLLPSRPRRSNARVNMRLRETQQIHQTLKVPAAAAGVHITRRGVLKRPL